MPIRTDSVSSLPKFELPIVIPVFNGVTYLSNTIDFFKARGFDEYLILNNGSAYPPLEEYLSKVPDGVTVLDLPHNPGPRVFNDPGIYSRLPEQFILTDPDLGFKPELDRESVLHLFELCEQYKRYKLGCALNIWTEEPSCVDTDITTKKGETTIRNIEDKYYRQFLGVTKYGDTIYDAPIDTTFAAYDKRYSAGKASGTSGRIVGRYSAEHYGWYDVPPIPADEYEYYKVAVSTTQFASTEWVKSGKKYTY